MLDIMMPGRTGMEVCEYVRSKWDVPVIFLTALNTEGDIVSGYGVGADEYVTKPFSTSLVRVNGKKIDLAPKEYALLIYFIENKGIVLSRDQILDRVWGEDCDAFDRAVDTHVKKLRKELGKASYHVETVIKAGYVWK